MTTADEIRAARTSTIVSGTDVHGRKAFIVIIKNGFGLTLRKEVCETMQEAEQCARRNSR